MDFKKEKKILEQIANKYHDDNPGRAINRKIMMMVVRQVMPWINGPDVLEMGFGEDAWTANIIKKFGKSSIVDASEILLKQARGKYGKKIIAFHNLFEEFEPPVKYDSIIASFILEHVENPIEILKKAKSWLKPKGQIIVIVPNANSFHRRVAVEMKLHKKVNDIGRTDKQIGHRRVYTVVAMKKDITSAGLKIKGKKGLFLKFLPQDMMTGFSDDLLMGFMKLGENIPMEDCATIAFDCRIK
ncbi:MAG: class I SAM-dependent methyltransferase [Candidatus Omnitrophica bacterium]|nr:class I SAM-dependent methyltransferase [Candidatus Omnitrophota bacterium]